MCKSVYINLQQNQKHSNSQSKLYKTNLKSPLMSQNLYQKIYDELNITISQQTTYEQAEEIAKHLGYVYNTFGLIVKDFISLMGYKFKSDRPQADKSKKDKKNNNMHGRGDKKLRSENPIEEQQLEGKYKLTPPNRLIKQIQNYNQPGNILPSPHEQLLRQKLLKLKQLKSHTNSEEKNNTQEPKNTNAQKQKNSNDNNNTNSNSSSKKISLRKKKDPQVINISSQDEEKQEDSLSGVKTRAQQRGQHRPLINPDALLRRGRGRGRGRRGRGSSRTSSSRVQNQQSNGRQSHYPLNPTDPFTIIYNVPYNPTSKITSNASVCSTPSKKDQKMQKRLLKQLSQSDSSQLQRQQDENAQKPIQRNLYQNTAQQVMSPYNSQSFIQKVMASYNQQKHLIRQKLDHLDKEYEKQKLTGKIWDRQNKMAPQQHQEDEYEYDIEEQISFEKQPNAEEQFDQIENYQAQNQQVLVQQQQQEQQLPFQKLNPSPKPRPQQNSNDSYSYLQQLNQSIQQQFEQNLRMNQQINQEQNQYQQEISYNSPAHYQQQQQQQQQQPQEQYENIMQNISGGNQIIQENHQEELVHQQREQVNQQDVQREDNLLEKSNHDIPQPNILINQQQSQFNKLFVVQQKRVQSPQVYQLQLHQQSILQPQQVRHSQTNQLQVHQQQQILLEPNQIQLQQIQKSTVLQVVQPIQIHKQVANNQVPSRNKEELLRVLQQFQPQEQELKHKPQPTNTIPRPIQAVQSPTLKQTTLPTINQPPKPTPPQQTTQQQKKPSSNEFIPFIKKSKYIEVIELE